MMEQSTPIESEKRGADSGAAIGSTSVRRLKTKYFLLGCVCGVAISIVLLFLFLLLFTNLIHNWNVYL